MLRNKTMFVVMMAGATQQNTISPLFQDLLTTSRSAGAINATLAEPGPAPRVVVDSASKLTISGNKIVCSGWPAAPSLEDPAISLNQAIYRLPGRSMMFTITPSDATPDVFTGLYTSPSAASFVGNRTHGVQFGAYDAVIYYRMDASPYSIAVGALAANNEYTFMIVERSAGCFLFVKGGAFVNWTLLWVDNTNADFGYICTSFYLFLGSMGPVSIIDLPDPFNDDYGFTTNFKAGARSGGDTFTHTADCLIEYTVKTRNSAGSITLNFRKQDANNYWQVAIASNGALTLNEVVAGTPTARGTAAAGSIASGGRMVIQAIGQNIRVVANNVSLINYASAANFVTATAGALASLGTGGAVKDIVSWPAVYGTGSYPSASRVLTLSASVNVDDFGADPTGATDSTNAIQAAIWSGSTINFTSGATYLVNRRMVIPSNRSLVGLTAGATIKKGSAISAFFTNLNASNTLGRKYDSNISLSKITFDCDNQSGGRDLAGRSFYAHLAFCFLSGLTLTDITMTNGTANQYAIQLIKCSSVTATNWTYTGLKDGFHVGPGCSNITLTGGTINAGDDTVAILAHEYPYVMEQAGDITNVTIAGITSNSGVAPGFLTRMITGSWLPWTTGNTYDTGHLCVSGGKLYQMVTDGPLVSTIAPTHPWGKMTGADNIEWQWVGDGSQNFGNITNVNIHDTTILDSRYLIRIVEDLNENHNHYPGTTGVLDQLHTDLHASQFTDQGGAGGLGSTSFDEGNLITNGDFANTTGWASNYEAVLASIAGGVVHNCLRVTGGAPGVGCASFRLTLPANTAKTLTIYHKNGTAMGRISISEAAGTWPGDGEDANEGAWTLHTLAINVAYANPYINLWMVGAAGATTLFDEAKVE